MKKIFILLFLAGSLFASDWETGGKVYMDIEQLYVSTISGHSPIFIDTPLIRISSTTKIGNELNSIQISTSTITLPKKLTVQELNIEASGVSSHGRAKFHNADVEIEDANRGLILTSTGTHRFLLWVDDNGNLFTTQIAASPEISFEERKARIAAKKATRKNLMNEYKNTTSGNVIHRLDIIEQILGLK